MTEPTHEGEDRAAGDVAGMSYTEASAELDEIVQFFEQRDVDIDQLVGRLVRATAIVEELDERLRRTRLQVEQLVPRLAAILSDDRSATGETGPLAGEPGEGSDAPGGSGDTTGAAAADDEAPSGRSSGETPGSALF